MTSVIFTHPLVAAANPAFLVDTLAVPSSVLEMAAATAGLLRVLEGTESDVPAATAAHAVLRDIYEGRIQEAAGKRNFLVERTRPLPHPVLRRGIFAAHHFFATAAPDIPVSEPSFSRTWGQMIDWNYLRTCVRGVMGGDKEAWQTFRRLVSEGHSIEMALAVEALVGERENSSLYLEETLAAVKNIEVDLKRRLEHGENKDVTAKLKCLHDVLRDNISTFDRGEYPFFLGDLLRSRVEQSPGGSGHCYPMALLSIHLGHAIGLSLKPYFSEEHVSVWVDADPPFLFEPTNGTTLPVDYWSRLEMAPDGAQPSEGAFFLLHPVLTNPYESLSPDFLKWVVTAFPNEFWIWQIYGHVLLDRGNFTEASVAAQKAEALFPGSVYTMSLHAKILRRRGFHREAARSFESMVEGLKRQFRLLREAGYPGHSDIFGNLIFTAKFLIATDGREAGLLPETLDEYIRAFSYAVGERQRGLVLAGIRCVLEEVVRRLSAQGKEAAAQEVLNAIMPHLDEETVAASPDTLRRAVALLG